MDIVEIAQKLNEEHTALVEAQYEQYDHSRLWASDFGHPCDARQVLVRAHWEEDVREPSPFGQFRSDQEFWVWKRYREMGLDIVQTQPRFHNPELQLTGKPDAVLRIDGQQIVNDVKTSFFGKPATLGELQNADHASWNWRIYVQQHVVMFLSGIDQALITWVCQDGSLEFCPVPYDPDIAIMINARSLALNVALMEYREGLARCESTKEWPELPPVKWLPDLCPTCPWQGYCKVARTLTEGDAPAIGNEQLRQLCEERERWAEAAAKYKKAHKAARDAVLATGKDLIWLDGWEINVKDQHRNEHVVPEKPIRVVNIKRR